jgi:hypothetical protein
MRKSINSIEYMRTFHILIVHLSIIVNIVSRSHACRVLFSLCEVRAIRSVRKYGLVGTQKQALRSILVCANSTAASNHFSQQTPVPVWYLAIDLPHAFDFNGYPMIFEEYYEKLPAPCRIGPKSTRVSGRTHKTHKTHKTQRCRLTSFAGASVMRL